eukprot:g5797.t1
MDIDFTHCREEIAASYYSTYDFATSRAQTLAEKVTETRKTEKIDTTIDTKIEKTKTTTEIKTKTSKEARVAVMSTKKEVEEDFSAEEEEEEKDMFIVSPKLITVGSSFKVQYKRPRGGGPSVKGWIGLYKKGDGKKSYITHYYDTDDTMASSIDWSKGPNRSGDWEFRYYDRDYNLLAVSPVTAVSETIHRFNDTYPSKDNRVTLDSKQSQSSFWPDYLPEDTTRLFVMERSKNPSLVVYYANLRSNHSYPYVRRNIIKRVSKGFTEFDSDEPVRVRWYSWGWTKEPEINALSMLQVPFMGVSMKETGRNEFTGTLNALKEKSMKLRLQLDPRTNKLIPALVGMINGSDAILRKVFVKTKSSWTGMPTVEYADIYGVDLKRGKEVQERLKQ